jgi:hypothetical protein
MKNKHILFILNILTMISRLMKIKVSQKFFISLILYLFYNVDLLKNFEKLSKWIVNLNFVNNINFLTYDIFTKKLLNVKAFSSKMRDVKSSTWNCLCVN